MWHHSIQSPDYFQDILGRCFLHVTDNIFKALCHINLNTHMTEALAVPAVHL